MVFNGFPGPCMACRSTGTSFITRSTLPFVRHVEVPVLVLQHGQRYHSWHIVTEHCTNYYVILHL